MPKSNPENEPLSSYAHATKKKNLEEEEDGENGRSDEFWLGM